MKSWLTSKRLNPRFIRFKVVLVWFGCEILLVDVLGLDEPDAKSLILGRQTWKMYNILKNTSSAHIPRPSGRPQGRLRGGAKELVAVDRGMDSVEFIFADAG